MIDTEISEMEYHARRDAEMVRMFWHLRGYVNVTVDLIIRNEFVVGFTSNLKNGMPPGANPRDVAQLYRGREMPFA
jgi:hypothetical protein